jgi:hypothetical protein
VFDIKRGPDGKCVVCHGLKSDGCNIAGRIYVSSENLITGVMPPCPFIEPGMAEFVAVDNFFLEGVTSNEVGSMIPVMDTKEREFAISFGEFLRVCSQDLWSTGLWEDDETDTGIEG